MTRKASQGTQSRVFRNDKALLIWGFTLAWFVMLGLFTYIAVRDGGVGDSGVWGIAALGLFWLVGAGLANSACALPRVRVAVTRDAIVVRESFPLSRTEKRYLLRDLAPPRIDESKDSDGDTYYACVLDLPDGGRITVAESGYRPDVEAVLGALSAYPWAIARWA